MPTTRNQKAGTALPTISYGENLVHEHDEYSDHDHDHFEFDDDGPLEQNPIWMQDHVTLVSVGIDIGSGRHAGHLLAHQPAPLWRGPHQPLLRGLARDALPVAGGADALFRARSASTTPRSARSSTRPTQAAGLHPDQIDTGAVILTGEALRRENAEAIAEHARPSRAANSSAPPPAITWSRCSPPTARARSRVSHDRGKRILNIDIGGGTTKLGVVENGHVIATAAVAHRRPAAGGRRQRPHRAARPGRQVSRPRRPASTGTRAT